MNYKKIKTRKISQLSPTGANRWVKKGLGLIVFLPFLASILFLVCQKQYSQVANDPTVSIRMFEYILLNSLPDGNVGCKFHLFNSGSIAASNIKCDYQINHSEQFPADSLNDGLLRSKKSSVGLISPGEYRTIYCIDRIPAERMKKFIQEAKRNRVYLHLMIAYSDLSNRAFSLKQTFQAQFVEEKPGVPEAFSKLVSSQRPDTLKVNWEHIWISEKM